MMNGAAAPPLRNLRRDFFSSLMYLGPGTNIDSIRIPLTASNSDTKGTTTSNTLNVLHFLPPFQFASELM